MIIIRQGSIQEVVALTLLFPEFIHPYLADEYMKRLHKTPHLILVAEVENKLAGCKIGYEREKDGSFYSWIGGVLPDYRRMGIARRLAMTQEKWAKEKGYKCIRFKTLNRHVNMLVFALQSGFQIIGFEPYSNHEESRIWLEKKL